MKINKQELLDFVNSLPDNVEVEATNILEADCYKREWTPVQNPVYSDLGGHYETLVTNTITMTFKFDTKYEGFFKRTYENREGIFRNVRRVN